MRRWKRPASPLPRPGAPRSLGTRKGPAISLRGALRERERGLEQPRLRGRAHSAIVWSERAAPLSPGPEWVRRPLRMGKDCPVLEEHHLGASSGRGWTVWLQPLREWPGGVLLGEDSLVRPGLSAWGASHSVSPRGGPGLPQRKARW